MTESRTTVLRLMAENDPETMALLFSPISWQVVGVDLGEDRRRLLLVEFNGSDAGAEQRIREALAALVQER